MLILLTFPWLYLFMCIYLVLHNFTSVLVHISTILYWFYTPHTAQVRMLNSKRKEDFAQITNNLKNTNCLYSFIYLMLITWIRELNYIINYVAFKLSPLWKKIPFSKAKKPKPKPKPKIEPKCWYIHFWHYCMETGRKYHFLITFSIFLFLRYNTY